MGTEFLRHGLRFHDLPCGKVGHADVPDQPALLKVGEGGERFLKIGVVVEPVQV